MSTGKLEDIIDDLLYGHPETRKKAAVKLGRIRDPKGIPHLIHTITHDEYSWARISAIQSLTWIADPSVVEPLMAVASNDRDPLVREYAIEAIGNLRDIRGLDVLQSISQEKGISAQLREKIANAITKIQNQ